MNTNTFPELAPVTSTPRRPRPSAEGPSVTLRPGRPDDAEATARICYEAFGTISAQHNFPNDFPSRAAALGFMEMALSLPFVYSAVAEREGRIVGSNFLWMGDSIAGVGPITIDPEEQNRQVGRMLMEDVLRQARESRKSGVRLVQAAYHGRSLALYTKLGFDAREPLSVLQGEPLNLTIPGYVVREATEGDVARCNAICMQVHGITRESDLQGALRQGTFAVAERNGYIVGYTTGIGYFSHTVAVDNEALKALIGAAPAFIGPGFLLPTRNADLLRWCLKKGLRIVQPLTLMSMGMYHEPDGAFLPSILY